MECIIMANSEPAALRKAVSRLNEAFRESTLSIGSISSIDVSIRQHQTMALVCRLTENKPNGVTLKELADKVAELEIKYGRHDEALQLLSRLLFPEPTPVVSAPPLPKRKIGFNGKRLEQGPQDAGR